MRFWLAAALSLLSLNAAADVQFATDKVQVVEGAGQVSVPVVLTAQDSRTGVVTVNYRTRNGSAVSPDDYGTTAGTLVWQVDDFAAKSILIPIKEDALRESTENFAVELFDSAGALLGATRESAVEIFDNDAEGPGKFQFTVTDLLVFESSATATLKVRRIDGTAGAVSVEVTRITGGTASPGVDFGDDAKRLDWANGEGGEKTFTITIVNDTVVEPTETIQYILINPAGGATIDRGEAQVSIGDDDFEGQGQVGFLSQSYDVVEGQATVSVQIARLGGSSGSAAVNYATAAGTATTADFGPVAGTLVWESGDTSTRSITIGIRNDGLVESTESFKVNITSVGGTPVSAANSTTINILDDDEPSTQSVFSLSADRYVVADNQTFIPVTVTRTNIDNTANVTISTSPITASAPEDFSLTSRTLTFSPGDTTRVVNIPIVPAGTTAEPDETFLVSLDQPVNSVVGAPDTAIVTIKSTVGGGGGTLSTVVPVTAQRTIPVDCGLGDDIPTVVVEAYSATAIIGLTRTGDTSAAGGVNYTTIDCSAVAGSDYTASTGAVTWQKDDASQKTIAIPVSRASTDTDFVEEEFLVELTAGAGTKVSEGLIRVVIKPVPGAFSIIEVVNASLSAYDDEGLVDVFVRRTGSGNVTVNYETIDIDAQAGVNYVGSSGTLEWVDGGPDLIAIRIQLLRSTEVGPDKQFQVVLTSGAGPVAFTGPGKTTVTVKSSAAKESKGVGGCTLGRSDWVTFAFMLLVSMGWFLRRPVQRADAA